MVSGAPDEQFLPRRDLELDEAQLHDRAHEFAEMAADHDTLEALMELRELPEDTKGEVIRLGLAELRKREDAGHAERFLRRIALSRRPLGRTGLRAFPFSRGV